MITYGIRINDEICQDGKVNAVNEFSDVSVLKFEI